MASISPLQGRSFFQAAAHFYRQAPWRAAGEGDTIEVERQECRRGPWYAVVLGKLGMLKGLLLFDDLKGRMLMGHDDGYQSIADQLELLCVYFQTIDNTLRTDLAEVERFDLEIAGPEAYPVVYRQDRNRSYRRPNSSELKLMEGCLRAIPEFVNRHKQDNPAKEAAMVSMAYGQLKLGLSWVNGTEQK